MYTYDQTSDMRVSAGVTLICSNINLFAIEQRYDSYRPLVWEYSYILYMPCIMYYCFLFICSWWTQHPCSRILAWRSVKYHHKHKMKNTYEVKHLTGTGAYPTFILDGNCETDGEASVGNQQYLNGQQSRLHTHLGRYQHPELEGTTTNECCSHIALDL